MKKKFMALFIFFTLINVAFAADLGEYPEIFEENNAKIVVSQYSDTPHQLLAYDIRYIISGTKIYSPEDIDTLDQNLILIGNACENSIVDELRNYPVNCREKLNRGEGRAEIIEQGNHTILIIESYDKFGMFSIRESLNKEKLNGKVHTVFDQNIETQNDWKLLLRKNRLNHIIDEYGQQHTIKFIDVNDNNYPIVEIDGIVLASDNKICSYDQLLTAKNLMYITIELNGCEKQINNSEKKESAESQENEDSHEDEENITPEKKFFLSKIFDWFIGLFK